MRLVIDILQGLHGAVRCPACAAPAPRFYCCLSPAFTPASPPALFLVRPLLLPLQYALGAEPGDYIIITALSKDQLVYNVTYTTHPVVAAPLPMPFNPTLHQRLQTGAADPQIGSVRGVQDLVLTVCPTHLMIESSIIMMHVTLSVAQHEACPVLSVAAATQ
jgi:hypothetical protein